MSQVGSSVYRRPNCGKQIIGLPLPPRLNVGHWQGAEVAVRAMVAAVRTIAALAALGDGCIRRSARRYIELGGEGGGPLPDADRNGAVRRICLPQFPTGLVEGKPRVPPEAPWETTGGKK